MNNYVANVLIDLFNDAQNGKVVIGMPESQYGTMLFDTKFYVKMDDRYAQNPSMAQLAPNKERDDDKAVINIPDFNSLVNLAENYLAVARKFYSQDKSYWLLDEDDYGFDKKLLLDLFVNCGINDFNNIETYLQTRTSMLKSSVNEDLIDMGEYNSLQIKSKISKEHSFMESPYTFNALMIDPDGGKYSLPSIYFGVEDDTVYLYAIKHKKASIKKLTEEQSAQAEKDAALHKKLDRYLRKVNKGIAPDEVMMVAPNAIVAITLFAEYMKENNLFKLVAPSFMPIRYQGKRDSVARRLTTKQEIDAWTDEYDGIQYNVTNRLIDTLHRYAQFFDDSSCYYDDISTNTYIKLSKNKKMQKVDNIIYDIAQSVANGVQSQKN